MKPMLTVTATLAIAACMQCEASAGTRSFVLNGHDLARDAGLSTDSVAGFALPGDSDSSGAASIILPKDYKKNTKVRLLFRVVTQESGCAATIRGAGAVRLRTGKVASTLIGASSGFTLVGSESASVPGTSGKGFTREFALKPAASGTIQSQRPGDNILIVIERDGDGGGDTCTGPIVFTSVKVTYTTP